MKLMIKLGYKGCQRKNVVFVVMSVISNCTTVSTVVDMTSAIYFLMRSTFEFDLVRSFAKVLIEWS